MAKKDMCLRVAHWALRLEKFEYTVEHRAGTSMKHADALSRNPIECMMVHESQHLFIAQIRRAQEDNPESQKIMQAVKDGTNEDFVIVNGVLCKENYGNPRIVIPKLMQQEF